MKDTLPSATQPWLAHKDWARGEVLSSDRRSVLGLWLFTLFWNGVSWPVIYAVSKNPPRDKTAWLVLFFPAIGIVMAGVAIRATLRYKKFGTSTFKMLSIPGTIGGSLSGVIQTNTKIRPEDGFNIHLKCLKRETTGTGKNKRTVERLLWEDYKTLRAEMLQDDQRRSGIPVFFEIPADCRETDAAESIGWRLEVSAKVPGIDYTTSFEVPVFRLAEIPVSKISANEFAAKFELETNLAGAVRKAGILVEDGSADGLRFSFARGRNRGLSVNAITYFVICAVASYFLWKANGLGIKFFAVMLSLLTILALWSIGECLLKSVEVFAGPEGLRVRTNRGYARKDISVAASDIQSIKAHSSLQVGNTRYFEIRVRATSDSPMGFRTLIAGSGIKGVKEAEWIVDQMYSALNLAKTHEAAQNLKN